MEVRGCGCIFAPHFKCPGFANALSGKREVVQPGRIRGLGPRGRRFESCPPDKQVKLITWLVLFKKGLHKLTSAIIKQSHLLKYSGQFKASSFNFPGCNFFQYRFR